MPMRDKAELAHDLVEKTRKQLLKQLLTAPPHKVPVIEQKLKLLEK